MIIKNYILKKIILQLFILINVNLLLTIINNLDKIFYKYLFFFNYRNYNVLDFIKILLFILMVLMIKTIFILKENQENKFLLKFKKII